MWVYRIGDVIKLRPDNLPLWFGLKKLTVQTGEEFDEMANVRALGRNGMMKVQLKESEEK